MANSALEGENAMDKLRFKDVLKRHMKNVDINTQTWEEDAMDRKQ